MIVAVHALIGAALGRFARSHTQAVLLGSASHPVSDMLPHRDLEVPQEAALLAAVLTVITATKGVDSREFTGAVGAALPDLENLIGRFFGIPEEKLLLPSHNRYHGRKTDGFAGQLVLAVAGLALLLLPSGE